MGQHFFAAFSKIVNFKLGLKLNTYKKTTHKMLI